MLYCLKYKVRCPSKMNGIKTDMIKTKMFRITRNALGSHLHLSLLVHLHDVLLVLAWHARHDHACCPRLQF